MLVALSTAKPKGPLNRAILFVPSGLPELPANPAKVVTTPVGLVDLAPTFCAIAGIEPGKWMQGGPLPLDDTGGPERVLTEWDSELFGVAVHLRTITRGRWVCTAYLPGTVHDGSEGELYDLVDDPRQRHNRWDDPSQRALRDDLVADLWDSQPAVHQPHLQLEAPV